MDDSNEKIHIVPSFDKGMQSATTRFLPQQEEVALAKNTDLNYKLGGIAKCLGYDRLGDAINSGNTILGGGAINLSGGTSIRIAFSGTDAYIYNSGTGAWAAQSQTFTASQNFFVIPVMDAIIVINGITDAPKSYNESAWSTTALVTDMPKARYGVYLDNRIYLFNLNLPVAGNQASMVWFSDIIEGLTSVTWGFESGTDLAQTASSAVVTSAAGLFKTRNIKVGDDFYITTGTNAGRYTVKSIDSETQITLTVALAATQSNSSFWCGGNYFYVEKENSDVGMGLSVNSGRVLCFKRHSLSRFQKTTNTGTDSLIRVKGAPGTTSQRSVVNIGANTYYYCDAGIVKYDGIGSTVISTPMQEVIDGVAAASLTSIVGWSEDNRILKMFVGSVSNADTGLTITNCVICHDTARNTWWTEEYPDVIKAAAQNYIDTTGLKNYLFSSGGECFVTQTGNDFDGDEINMEVEGHPVFPISPEVDQIFTRARFYHQRGHDLQISYKLYFFGQGRVDAEWRAAKVSYRSEHETEIKFDDDIPRAAGIAFKYKHMSADGRPVIEREALYYRSAKLRNAT